MKEEGNTAANVRQAECEPADAPAQLTHGFGGNKLPGQRGGNNLRET